MNFLDPDKKIIYNIYESTTFRDNNLVTIKDTCKYNQNYSGKLAVTIKYKDFENSILSINENIYNILPFKDGVTENKDSGH
jgi:hypothetical protein